MNSTAFSAYSTVWITLLLVSLVVTAVSIGLLIRERRLRLALASKLDAASTRIATSQVLDDLTGLLSRAGFNVALDKAVDQAEAIGGVFCVVYALALTETDPPVLTGIDPVTMAGDGGMRR